MRMVDSKQEKWRKKLGKKSHPYAHAYLTIVYLPSTGM